MSTGYFKIFSIFFGPQKIGVLATGAAKIWMALKTLCAVFIDQIVSADLNAENLSGFYQAAQISLGNIGQGRGVWEGYAVGQV